MQNKQNEILKKIDRKFRRKHSHTDSLRNTFLDNLEYVEKLLKSGTSFKQQSEKFSNNIRKISVSSYANFSKLYLYESFRMSPSWRVFYQEACLVFSRNYFISFQENSNCLELYNFLIKENLLRTQKNKLNSNVSYEDFEYMIKETFESRNIELEGFFKINDKNKNKYDKSTNTDFINMMISFLFKLFRAKAK